MRPKVLYSHPLLNYQVLSAAPTKRTPKVLQQIHSNIVVTPIEAATAADGFIILEPLQQHYAIVTADCMPIVIQGKKGIGFVHAGWKGVRDKIISHSNFAAIEPEVFLIGPHIHACCYTVATDFRQNFPTSNAFIQHQDQLYFNLQQQQIEQITQVFPDSKIITSNECTCCNLKYHSYRRDKTSLRNWNIIYY